MVQQTSKGFSVSPPDLTKAANDINDVSIQWGKVEMAAVTDPPEDMAYSFVGRMMGLPPNANAALAFVETWSTNLHDGLTSAYEGLTTNSLAYTTSDKTQASGMNSTMSA